MKNYRFSVLILFLNLCIWGIFSTFAFAEDTKLLATTDSDKTERIVSYESDITINNDKTATLTENIKVVCNQENIKHGIFRNLPEGYNIIEVLKNGKKENYTITDTNKSKCIYIGRIDVELSPGEYTYTLKYKIHNISAFFKSSNEFYFDVFGDGWSFPVESAKIKVSGLKELSSVNCTLNGYTGDLDLNEKGVDSSIDKNGNAIFATTKKLEPYQGFSVSIKSAKELINESTKTAKFSDLPKNHWAYKAVSVMAEKGIINGYSNGTFKPNDAVTREQFAVMMVLSLNLPIVDSATPTFKDMNKSYWAYKYVESAKDYLVGNQKSDGVYFEGNSSAKREEIAYALVKAKSYDKQSADEKTLGDIFSDADKITQSMQKYVLIAYSKGIMKGYEDKTFDPKGTLTRAEAAQLLYNILILENNEQDKN